MVITACMPGKFQRNLDLEKIRLLQKKTLAAILVKSNTIPEPTSESNSVSSGNMIEVYAWEVVGQREGVALIFIRCVQTEAKTKKNLRTASSWCGSGSTQAPVESNSRSSCPASLHLDHSIVVMSP
jgi:hypothetical protein